MKIYKKFRLCYNKKLEPTGGSGFREEDKLRLLRTRFSRKYIEQLIKRGIVSNCAIYGTPFDEAWNAAYRGMVDIHAWYPKDKVPVWMNVRVDTKDGIPWLVNVAFKIPEVLIKTGVEKIAIDLANKFKLNKDKVSVIAYGANPDLQSFGSFGDVLQINSSNEDPKKLLPFLRAVEEMFLTTH